MKKELKLASFSWPQVISLVWQISDEMKQQGIQMNWRTCIELFGAGGFEMATRDPKQQSGFLKMVPDNIRIATKYLEAGGEVDEWFLHTMTSAVYAAKQDQLFADALTGRRGAPTTANWISVNANASKLLYIFSSRLKSSHGPKAAAHFLQQFRLYGRDNLERSEQTMLHALELQSGLGLFAALAEAKEALPDLLAEELAGAMIKKYGVADKHGLPSCTWCGHIPCRCQGEKSEKRKVSADDVAEAIHTITPWHTQQCMELAYGLARNGGIGGDGYGPARVSYERAEAMIAGLFLEANGDPETLAENMGPLFHGQEQRLKRYEEQGKRSTASARHAMVGELGDTVQWLMLILSGKLDHAGGLRSALEQVSKQLGISLMLPETPQPLLPQ